MTEPDSKFEEEIRSALCAASDLVVPAGDGLNKIRERAARRPAALGWLRAYAAYLPDRLARGLRVAASEVAATARGHSTAGLVLQSARRWPRRARHALRSPSMWLRPVLTAAAALFIVLAATLAVPQLRGAVRATFAGLTSSSHNPGGGPPGGGPGGAQSNSATGFPSGSGSQLKGKPFHATMSPSGRRCRSQGSSGTGYATRAQAPRLGPTTGAGTGSIGAAPLWAAGPGTARPEPAATTCPAAASPATTGKSRTTPPSTTPPPTTPPPTTPPPTTPPPTTPVTTPPPTTPVTTPPPTTPVTTPPPITPVTTPPTTPATMTNSPAESPPPESPNDSAPPGSPDQSAPSGGPTETETATAAPS